MRALVILCAALGGCFQYTIAESSIAELNSVPRNQWARVAVPAKRGSGEGVYLRGDGFRELGQNADHTHRVRVASRAVAIAGSLLLAAGAAFATAGTVFAAERRSASEVALWVPGAAFLVASAGVFIAATRRSTYEVRRDYVGTHYEEVAAAATSEQIQPRPPKPVDLVMVRAFLAMSLMGKGDYRAAAEMFEEVLVLRSDVDKSVHINLAICYIRLSRFDDALREIETFLRLDPGNARGQAVYDDVQRNLRDRRP